MTIGSNFNYPADIAAQRSRSKRSEKSKWRGRFPNPPDLCFDYRALVELDGGIANATESDHKICIVGAGITGLTTARELYRCGFTHITVLEKSKRIGGRHLTVLGNHNSNNIGRPPFEMGAMRMPFLTGRMNTLTKVDHLWPITPKNSTYFPAISRTPEAHGLNQLAFIYAKVGLTMPLSRPC